MAPEVARRLAFIRYLLTTAVEQSRMPEPLAPVSLLSFHDAVELFLQLASERLDAGTKQPNFMEYWDLLAPKLPNGQGLSQKESMRRLNKARVALKHNGTFPSKLDVEAFRATTLAFFEENTPTIFGVSLDSVSMVEFVQPLESKQALEQAEQALKEGDTKSAAAQVTLAFEGMLRAYESRKRGQFGRSPFYFGERLTFLSSFNMNIGRSGSDRSERKLAEFVDKVKESLESLQGVTKILALGIDYRRYSRFRLVTPRIHWGVGGQRTFTSTPEETTADDVRFCIDFVIESAIRLHDFDYDARREGSA
jgi:hypothetical protein